MLLHVSLCVDQYSPVLEGKVNETASQYEVHTVTHYRLCMVVNRYLCIIYKSSSKITHTITSESSLNMHLIDYMCYEFCSYLCILYTLILYLFILLYTRFLDMHAHVLVYLK